MLPRRNSYRVGQTWVLGGRQRACKKLRHDELLVTTLAGTRLRMEMDRVPLWRGDHVPVRQLVEDFARYPYLPRLRDATVLLGAIREGLGSLLWQQETFAYADGYDEQAKRYVGLRGGQGVDLGGNLSGLLVRSEVAARQLEAERVVVPPPLPPDPPGGGGGEGGGAGKDGKVVVVPPPAPPKARRFYGTVSLDPAVLSGSAGTVAEAVVQHLGALVGARVRVTLEIHAELPDGAPEQVVRTVMENARHLRFEAFGFEEE